MKSKSCAFHDLWGYYYCGSNEGTHGLKEWEAMTCWAEKKNISRLNAPVCIPLMSCKHDHIFFDLVAWRSIVH